MSHDDTHTRDLEPYFTASPSSPTGNSRGNGNGNGPFSPGNTPPLVFAFIAVGFIVFGLVIAFVYKTCRPLPTSSEPYHQRSSVPTRRPSIQKPKLWDIWITPNQRIPDEKREKFNDWNTFVVSFFFCFLFQRASISQLITGPQPLSASLAYPYSPSLPIRVPQQYVQGHVTRPVSWEEPDRRLFFRRPPTDTSLRVAVVISMPKPQEPMPNRTNTENEFHVGVAEVKWTG